MMSLSLLAGRTVVTYITALEGYIYVTHAKTGLRIVKGRYEENKDETKWDKGFFMKSRNINSQTY